MGEGSGAKIGTTLILVVSVGVLVTPAGPRCTWNPASGIRFTDLDLDLDDLSGDASWLAPSSYDFVSSYALLSALSNFGGTSVCPGIVRSSP